MVREKRNVVAAFAEGREVEFDDVEAIVKIFAELPFLDHIEKSVVGGGDDANVDVDGFVAAEAFEAAFLEDAEEFCLEAEAEVADFVEEERAVVGGFDATLAAHGVVSFQAKSVVADAGGRSRATRCCI